jgi:hypothetical protein
MLGIHELLVLEIEGIAHRVKELSAEDAKKVKVEEHIDYEVVGNPPVEFIPTSYSVTFTIPIPQRNDSISPEDITGYNVTRCTCPYYETMFSANPKGHRTDCPCWGTTEKHRLEYSDPMNCARCGREIGLFCQGADDPKCKERNNG